MALPSDFNTVRVYGKYVKLDGPAATGSVTFSVSSGLRLLSAATQTVILGQPITVTLVNGEFEVYLPATDDPDITPAFSYRVTEKFGAYTRTYDFAAPLGSSIDLTTVAPVEAPPAPGVVRVMSVNGVGPDASGNVSLLGDQMTINHWEGIRPTPYYIAHRGSGDVIPECSMEALDYAVNNGARAAEISVNMTADGVLVVNHDLTWDRTTNLSGTIATTPSTVALNYAKINNQAQCGPFWVDYPPKVATFEAVLQRYGGRIVMCVEAKNDAAYPAMMAMIERYGLQKSTIVKAYYTSSRIDQAREAGYQTFVYLTNPDINDANLTAAAAHADYLVIPAYTDAGPGFTIQTQTVVDQARAKGKPVWVWPVHRRSDATRLAAMGVEGIITAGYGYVASANKLLTSPRWWTKMVNPGEVVINQADPAYAVGMTDAGAIRLTRTGTQMLSLGAYCPVTAGSYTVAFEVMWDTLPADLTRMVWLGWGRDDDRYYQPSYNPGSSGNHAYLRANGTVGVSKHDASGTTLTGAAETTSTTLVAGTWYGLVLTVTPTTATLTRTDNGVVTPVWTDSTNRGGYLHIGKNVGGSDTAVLNVRALTVS